MAKALQWIRSLVFVVQMYLAMAVLAVIYIIPAIITRDAAYAAVRTYCRYVRWSARWMVGLRTEVRGEIPRGEVLIGSKHQSFLDIIMIVSVVPKPKFIMKSSLRRAPILGWFAMRIGCVPVDRGKRGAAVRRMIADVERGRAAPGQLIIYPQGTRLAPGVIKPYKVGTYVLYRETGQSCVPAATNVGLFWPRAGLMRKPGLGVVEFLPPIRPGLDQGAFMSRLHDEVETASDRLLAEAGFGVARG
ncbi:1-acyl-sn-glycerol-3-phosphate acyltransferase [Mesobaculum littorinae]|uniref:1-acyl-sn-glycerol-3-phosphate acyltransferase n=1 Tax=Mesobaculum littorinae TaxID=2486419 RepID=A0A438AE63_9RHOB|nr:lysophospholipid acyltransferase family protein [Mesobaculum littorinae]RVV96996.1 1-acyl-sn-glycerol-3-phosphate acyltransferase [Mesobaculum littorinae]